MASFHGKPACSCLAKWLPVYEAELLRLGAIKYNVDVYQLIGGATASAGTHSTGGAFDIGQYSDMALRVARQMGAATWHRGPAQGMIHHAHGVLKGCPHAASSAKAQVVDCDQNRNGLVNNGRDDGPRSGIQFPLRSYTAGIKWAQSRQAAAAKAVAAAEAAKKKATATIRALQFNMPGPDKIPNGDERAATGAKLALSAAPSIIGWNELVGPKDDGSASDFALTVDSHLGKNWFLYTPTTPFNENYISFDTDIYAIAKSYPDVILPSPKGAGRRHLTRLVLKHRETGLLFGVGQTHLVNGDSAAAAYDREAQAAQIVTSMRWMCFDFRGHLLPYIVQGDFNLRDRLKAFDGLEYTRWSGGSSTTRDHATYTNYAKTKPSTNTDWIIDAQVVSKEWGVVGYNVVRELNDDGTYVQPRPSDHDPIITAIRTIAA